MKANLSIAIAAFLALVALAAAHEKDKDGHKHEHALAGPNGGKVLLEVHPHAELFVTKDRKLQLTFIDHHGKTIAPKDQSVTVVCGQRTDPTRLSFAKHGDSLVSDKPLPEGLLIPTVLQFKMTPDAKTTTVRLNLNLEECPTCDHLEYACTCDHEHKDEKK